MEISSIASVDTVRFSLKGALSFRDKDIFAPILDAVADKTGLDVVLDLSSLDHVDSFGIGLLLLANEQAAAHGRGFSLVNPQGAVARVFEMADLDAVLNLRRDVPSRSPAVASMRAGIGYRRLPPSADGPSN